MVHLVWLHWGGSVELPGKMGKWIEEKREREKERDKKIRKLGVRGNGKKIGKTRLRQDRGVGWGQLLLITIFIECVS